MNQLLTLDFFNLQRSQALQTLLRTLLSECELSDVGVDCRAVMVYRIVQYSAVWCSVVWCGVVCCIV